MEWTMAYNPSGDHIGTPTDARLLCVNRGIQPVKREPEHSVCSIGFSVKDSKWYGWSHRAIFGFKIGSTCKRGNCHYQSPNRREFRAACKRFWTSDSHEQLRARYDIEDGSPGVRVIWTYANDIPNEALRGQERGTFSPYPSEWGRGEWTAKTVAEARQMACDFAEGVS
jgi:hypothetical protein